MTIEATAEIPLYAKRGISLIRGEGMYLWDADGRRYLDAMSNYGVNILGHSHPAVDSAVETQLKRLISCHQSFYNDARASFEQALTERLPAALTRLSYANSGAESIEAAIKFARAATGKQRVIAATRGYHGRTIGALSVTSGDKHRLPFEPLLAGCEHVPYDDVDALSTVIRGAGAVLLEPIQGEAGVFVPAAEYLTAVRRLCNENGALLILDEVQTGMGRTGTFLASEQQGTIPDILCLSKGIANGLPMGVTVVSTEVAERIPAGSHGSTFAGNPLACAAGRATIESVTEDLLEGVRTNGSRFVQRLKQIEAPLIREVRGRGLMCAVELRTRVTPLLKSLQERGVLALPAGGRTIRLLPPLIAEWSHLETIADTLADALAELSQ